MQIHLSSRTEQDVFVYKRHYCWHCFCKDNWIVSIFLRVVNNNKTGQHVSLFSHSVYNGDVKADRIGARLPSRLHCQLTFLLADKLIVNLNTDGFIHIPVQSTFTAENFTMASSNRQFTIKSRR